MDGIAVSIRGAIAYTPNQLCDVCSQRQAKVEVKVKQNDNERTRKMLVCNTCLQWLDATYPTQQTVK